jgi:hypothetical protein
MQIVGCPKCRKQAEYVFHRVDSEAAEEARRGIEALVPGGQILSENNLLGYSATVRCAACASTWTFRVHEVDGGPRRDRFDTGPNEVQLYGSITAGPTAAPSA